MNNNEAGPETKEQVLGKQAFEAAQKIIRERFEDGPEGDRLAYHNRVHTEGVVRRATRIAEAMNLSEHDQLLITIAASFHDVVQLWKKDERENGVVIRKRLKEANEEASAQEAITWMKSLPNSPFTNKDCELVREAILVTIPDWNKEHGTMVQPRLTPESHPAVRAVALADLGSFGMESASEEVDELFVEQELDLVETLRSAASPSNVDPQKQQEYLKRYQAWQVLQLGFVKGRKALFEEELGNLPESAKINLRELFTRFDDSVEIAARDVSATRDYTFEQLVERLTPYL